jgi:hypothetical protein
MTRRSGVDGSFFQAMASTLIQSESKRLPPGQDMTRDSPVLSAGPTTHTPLNAWTFALEAEGAVVTTSELVESLAPLARMSAQ